MEMLKFIKRKIRSVLSKISEDQRYYRKLKKLVPELASYKEYQIKFIGELAERAGLKSIKDYYCLVRNNQEEMEYFKQNLTYNGSHFFRGNDRDFFIENCLSALKGAEKVRIWCAACSSGQEVYSTIVSLADYVPLEKIDVLASDYNDEMIAKCADGSYFNMHLHEVPERYHKYLEKGPKKFLFKKEIRELVKTENINLLGNEYPKGFDVILCRNVLKFFSPEVIDECHIKLAGSLNRGGYLFLSHDDDSKKEEFIKDPESLGLEQLDGRCIYKKIS